MIDAASATMAATQITEGYVPGCIGRITHLHARHYAATSGFGAAFEAKVARELAAFVQAYTPGRDGLWLAGGEEIEGSVIIDGSDAHGAGAHLRWFITSDAWRGHGVGKRLLAQALAFADARQYARVFLWTFAGLDAARHLYEAQGFRLVLEAPGQQWGRVVREQRFERVRGRCDEAGDGTVRGPGVTRRTPQTPPGSE